MAKDKFEDMIHFMIDIETLGRTAGSVILSVGVVVFDIRTGDPVDEGAEFYKVVDLESCLDYDLRVDASTLLWWFSEEQDVPRKIMVEDLKDDPDEISEVLSGLAEFIEKYSKDIKKKVWAKPPSFDIMILEAAYGE